MNKRADMTVIIKHLAEAKEPGEMPPLEECPLKQVAQDMGQQSGNPFVSLEELKELGSDGETPDAKIPEPDEEKLKEACAYQLGLQFAWKEAGIDDDLRRHLMTKVALALTNGTLKNPLDFRRFQPVLEKEARQLVGEHVKTGMSVDPTTHLLLMALAGASIGGSGGWLVDQIKEKLTGKKPRKSMATAGLLGGAGAGLVKHLYDLHLEK